MESLLRAKGVEGEEGGKGGDAGEDARVVEKPCVGVVGAVTPAAAKEDENEAAADEEDEEDEEGRELARGDDGDARASWWRCWCTRRRRSWRTT